MFYAILFSLLGTVGGSILGSLIGLLFKGIHKEVLSFLSNFSLGSLLGLTLIEVFPEALEHMHQAIDNYFLSTLAVTGIVLGVGILFYLLHECTHLLTHHHKNDKEDESSCGDHAHSVELFEEKSLGFASFLFFIAISIHNIPEGLTLGGMFLIDEEIPINGIVTSIILLIHNVIIGYTMYNSFRIHNNSKAFSAMITTLSALPAFIFALIGYFITSISLSPVFIGSLLAVSTGSLLYVLFIEIIPIGLKDHKTKLSFIYVLLGIISFVLLISLGGHSH